MLILSVCLALVLGWLGGGRLARWEHARLRLLPLPIVALILQQSLALIPLQHYPILAPFPLLLSYGALFSFCFWNRHLSKTTLLMGGGSLCNLSVIAANSFRMPVATQAAAYLSPGGLADLQALRIPMYALANENTRLLFLGDILYCPIPLFRGFASVGDILLAVGLFFCLMAVMQPSRFPRWLCSG